MEGDSKVVNHSEEPNVDEEPSVPTTPLPRSAVILFFEHISLLVLTIKISFFTFMNGKICQMMNIIFI